MATELGKALADNGHQVHFITYSQPARLDFFSENLFYHEVSVSQYPLFDYPPYELVLASKLVDVVRFENLDLLHVHYAIPHASAAFMAKQILATYGINIPVVTTLHGTDITLVGKDVTFKPVVTFSINKSYGSGNLVVYPIQKRWFPGESSADHSAHGKQCRQISSAVTTRPFNHSFTGSEVLAGKRPGNG